MSDRRRISCRVVTLTGFEIVDDGGGAVALGKAEMNGRSGVQCGASAISEALHALEGVAGRPYDVVPMLAFAIDAVEDFGEVFWQEVDLAAGSCHGPDTGARRSLTAGG